MPSVAVVIPVYNRDEMLIRAIRSISRQERSPNEVVIIDDSSTADLSSSRSLADELGFHWVRLSENVGVAGARNVGVRETNAEWVCFLDSDDEWLPGKLDAQLRWHLEHPGIEISQVHEAWYREGRLVKKPRHWMQCGGDLFEDSVKRCSIGPSCVMLSRSLWEWSGGFDPQFRVCEDYALWLKVTASVPVGIVDGEPLVRKHAGHQGQLSVETSAMDRFRVHALIQALINLSLSDQQRFWTIEGILTKSKILEQGAMKRGEDKRGAFYREVGATNWEEQSASQIRSWIQRSEMFLDS